MIDAKIEQEEREKEAEIREKLEEQFSKEKQLLVKAENDKKKDLIDGIFRRNKDDEMIKSLAPALV